MNTMERRVHPNCVYKSNPYHECIEACFHKMPQQQQGKPNKKKSGNSSLNIQLVDVPKRRLSFRKKNNKEEESSENSADKRTLNPKSSSHHHQLDSPSSSSNYSPVEFSFNKVESWNCDVTILNNTRKLEEEDANNSIIKRGQLELDSMRSTLTDEESTTVELEEEDCSRRVAIGNYLVKESVSGILPSILNKYGDIAEKCTLESVALRSYYLECICFIILELLQSSSSTSSSNSNKLKEMLSIVKDAGCVGIDVGWLSPVVDRMGKVMELIKQRKAFQEEKREFDLNVVGSVRKELQLQLQVLAEKEEEASVARAGVEEIQVRVREMEEECLDLRDRMTTLLLQSSNSSSKLLMVEIQRGGGGDYKSIMQQLSQIF